MGKHLSFIIIASLLVFIATGSAVLWSQNSEKTTNLPVIPQLSPTATPPSQKSVIVGSPDGKWELTMKEEKKSGNITYIFTFLSKADNTSKVIYTQTLPEGTSLSIPYNTFSPDGKYIFLKEQGSTGTRYFALSTSGGPIQADKQTVDIGSLFAEKYAEYRLTDITGWGGVNMVLINTNKEDDTTGPSFWYNVSTDSFHKLSIRFN